MNKICMVDLSLSENLKKIPINIRFKIIKELRYCNKYPKYNSIQLYEKISLINKVDKSNIFITNGSDEAIEIIYYLFASTCNEHNNIIVTNNSYNGYEYASKLFNINVIKSNIHILDNKYYETDIIEKINNGTKCVFISNPHNPYGKIMKPSEIIRILDFTCNHNIIVVIDEAYFDFIDVEYKSAVSFIKTYSNLIVLKSFSKSYCMAGLRIGYIISHENTIKKLYQLIGKVIPFNVNRLAIKCATLSLEHNNTFTHYCKKSNNIKYKTYLLLDRYNYEYIKTQTNFILINLHVDVSSICLILEQKYNIKVKDGVIFSLPTYIRIGIGKYNDMKKLINTLNTINEIYNGVFNGKNINYLE